MLKKTPTKPIVWHLPRYSVFSGRLPEANAATFQPNCLDTTAVYRFAVLAIGIMLENVLPGRAFLIASEATLEEITHTRKWLEYVFNESFEPPIYFDKLRLLEHLEDHYEDKVELVGRFQGLYGRQFKRNMEFALQQIGEQPTLQYYARALANAYWGTLGFYDVFNAWIAATQDLEQSLALLACSKEILLSDPDNEKHLKQAAKYDYTRILKELLNQYILWTPEQREFLKQFPTNEKALKTGKDGDLFSMMLRLSNLRMDICPIHTSPDDLFEAFMYHDPKKRQKVPDNH